MSTAQTRRRALIRHGMVASLTVVALVAFVAAVLTVLVRLDAQRTAEQLAQRIRSAVAVPLAGESLSTPVDARTRSTLDGVLAPFLDSGIVTRVKIWAPRDDEARIVYSDESRVEGEVAPFDVEAVRSIREAGTLIRSVPQDRVHRFETARTESLLAVFSAVHDRTGYEAWLELYVDVGQTGSLRGSTFPILVATASGLVVLALATFPLTLAAERRRERERAEQEAARRYGWDAAEVARREVAERLHSGVLPDLASVGLLLESARGGRGAGGEEGASAMLGRANALLDDEMRELRCMLDDLSRPPVVPGGLAGALRDLHERLPDPEAVTIVVDTDGLGSQPDDLELTLYRVAHELVTNAVRHGGARHVEVSVTSRRHGWAVLRVTDDGQGFDVGSPAPPGHVGLVLARRVLEDRGGDLTMTSADAGGSTVIARVPDASRRRVRWRASRT